jgi:hypothetical protein
MKITTDVAGFNTKIKPGFIAGVVVEFPLKNNMAINTSLNFKSIGTWIKDGGDLTSWRLNYLIAVMIAVG